MRFLPTQGGLPATLSVAGVSTLIVAGALHNETPDLLAALDAASTIIHLGDTGRIRVPATTTRIALTIGGEAGHIYANVWFTPTPDELAAVLAAELVYQSEFLTDEEVDSAPALGEEIFPTPAFANSTGLISAGSWTISGNVASSDGGGEPMVFGPTNDITEGLYEAIVEISTNLYGDDVSIAIGGANGASTNVAGEDPSPTPGVGIYTLSGIVVDNVTEQTIKINEGNGVPVTITSLSVKRTA
jgi:hypothetical protein